MKIILATKNRGKIKDFEKLTDGMDIEVLSILDNIDFPDVVEDGKTFEENSAKKALEIAKYTGIVTVSDDSGLCVDILNGEPGIYSARYSGEDGNDEKNIEKLLENLSDIEKNDRKAHFVSVVSIAFPDGTVKSFREKFSLKRKEIMDSVMILCFIHMIWENLLELQLLMRRKV